MINLPKPSQQRLKGSYEEKMNYLLNYITTLVTAIEQLLSGAKNYSSNDDTTVKDVSVVNKKLKVFFTDGSEKTIDL